MRRGEGHLTAIGEAQAAVPAQSGCLAHARFTNVHTHVQGAVEGDRGKVPIPAAHIQNRGLQRDRLVELRLHRSQHGAEVRQVAKIMP